MNFNLSISGGSSNDILNSIIDTDYINNNNNKTTANAKAKKNQTTMASMSVSSSSSTTTSSPVLENYLVDLKRVIEWLISSENVLTKQTGLGNDVNTVKQQFQTHEDFMLDLTKHQNNVGLVLQEGSRLINSGTISAEDDIEVRKQMKLLNDMWENLRLQAVERQGKLHDKLMKLQTDQLNQMDIWLKTAEARIQNISNLSDSIEGLVDQKDELSQLQDDLVKEQEAVDCLKQIIVVVDDSTDDQAFTDLENKLSSLSDRWSNVCKFVGNRWFTIQDLIIKLQSIETDFSSLNIWIDKKAVQLDFLIRKTRTMTIDAVPTNKNVANLLENFTYENESFEFKSSLQLIKVLKEVELEMQAMHAKLNDMNEIGEQIGTQLANSPQLSQSINYKMDTLEVKWNSLLEKIEVLSKICTEQQQKEIIYQQKLQQPEKLKLINSSSTITSLITVNNATSSSTSGVPNSVALTTSTVSNGTNLIDDGIVIKSSESGIGISFDNNSNINNNNYSNNNNINSSADSASASNFSLERDIKKRTFSEEELKQHTTVDPFLEELEKLFEKIKILNTIEDYNTDEVQELIKVSTFL